MAFYSRKITQKVRKILMSGKVNYWTGNECKNFEKDFSKYHKIKYSIDV